MCIFTLQASCYRDINTTINEKNKSNAIDSQIEDRIEIKKIDSPTDMNIINGQLSGNKPDISLRINAEEMSNSFNILFTISNESRWDIDFKHISLHVQSTMSIDDWVKNPSMYGVYDSGLNPFYSQSTIVRDGEEKTRIYNLNQVDGVGLMSSPYIGEYYVWFSICIPRESARGIELMSNKILLTFK